MELFKQTLDSPVSHQLVQIEKLTILIGIPLGYL